MRLGGWADAVLVAATAYVVFAGAAVIWLGVLRERRPGRWMAARQGWLARPANTEACRANAVVTEALELLNVDAAYRPAPDDVSRALVRRLMSFQGVAALWLPPFMAAGAVLVAVARPGASAAARSTIAWSGGLLYTIMFLLAADLACCVRSAPRDRVVSHTVRILEFLVLPLRSKGTSPLVARDTTAAQLSQLTGALCRALSRSACAGYPRRDPLPRREAEVSARETTELIRELRGRVSSRQPGARENLAAVLASLMQRQAAPAADIDDHYLVERSLLDAAPSSGMPLLAARDGLGWLWGGWLSFGGLITLVLWLEALLRAPIEARILLTGLMTALGYTTLKRLGIPAPETPALLPWKAGHQADTRGSESESDS